MPPLEYSIPIESQKLLLKELIHNPLHDSAPAEVKDAVKHVKFIGRDLPTLPMNWRFAESISALKGFQGTMLNVLLKRKYGSDFQEIEINTDHAQLFLMPVLLTVIDPNDRKITLAKPGEYGKYFPPYDFFRPHTTFHNMVCTNIYRTMDGRFYHTHGSMNPQHTQDALGIPHYLDPKSPPEARLPYDIAISKLGSQALDSMINDEYRQAGAICLSKDEYLASPQGKANAHVGLYDIHHIPHSTQLPGWWTSVEGHTSPSRPLFGLKVLDLTRIIAGPTISRELAELGASVMRITAPHIPDLSIMHVDMNWGKWNASLDLRNEADRAKLRDLVFQSDVVLDGYRPGVMEKWGFGKDDILKLFEGRDRGIIYARENCYGWNGPWAHRSGWQQISDAVCGVSLEFGRAMGNDEPVTPVFPNSDACTGVCGATGILEALIEKAEKGGSFVVDIALNYYSQWLINSCSTYPPDVWEALYTSYGRPVFRHTDSMHTLLPAFMGMISGEKKASPPGTFKVSSELFGEEMFEDRESKALGVDIRMVKPVLKFPGGGVKLGYNVGTRGNGVDAARWPKDLLTEVISEQC